MKDQDKEFMKLAIDLSAKNLDGKNGGPFGAVITKNGKLISQSENLVKSTWDATAHAEIMAIRLASKELQTENLSGCILYTSCEPCPMCLAAIYWAKIDKVFYANSGSDASKIGFDDEFLYTELHKPKAERDLPMAELSKEEGNKVFKLWEESRS